VGIDRYEIYRDGVAVASVPAGATAVTIRLGAGTFTVRAFDTAGNRSTVLATTIATPATRPKGAPQPIPAWAWARLAWQLKGSKGKAPVHPVKLPPWYEPWAAWRKQPYTLSAG
jgi:hypothetical protein